MLRCRMSHRYEPVAPLRVAAAWLTFGIGSNDQTKAT